MKPSTSIKSWEYDQEEKLLTLEFVKGGTTTIRNVEPDEYQAFLSAPSQGKFFNDRWRRK